MSGVKEISRKGRLAEGSRSRYYSHEVRDCGDLACLQSPLGVLYTGLTETVMTEFALLR